MAKTILPITILTAAACLFAADVEINGDIQADYASYWDKDFSPTNAANQDIGLSLTAYMDENFSVRPDWFPSAEERTRQQCRSVCAFYSSFHSSSEDTSAMLQSSLGIDHIHLVPTLRETIPAIFFLASLTVRREGCAIAFG